MQRIAVVLLNWNGLDLLKKFLPSVVKHSSEAVVYVADNASTDASRAFIAENYPTVKWIQLPQNYGYAKGYNEALKQINEEILCLINTDIEVTEHWLDRKSTRLNSSHVRISYAVFCMKKNRTFTQ